MRKHAPSETLLVFVCLGILGFILFEQKELLFAALGIGFLGLLSRKFKLLLHTTWSFLSEKMGRLMSSLLLSIIFFLILSPIAFLFRRFNKETPFHIPENEKTTFVSRDYRYKQEDLKNPW